MHAIIRLGNGKFYTSAVFGYYNGKDTYDIYGRYFIVFDRDKTGLVKQKVFDRANKFLTPLVLIIRADTSDLKLCENGGEVSFLTMDKLLSMVGKPIPGDIMERLLELDKSYEFKEYSEIKSEQDIDDLMSCSGGFHDAYIKELHTNSDGSLTVLFDGVWGCKIEMIFSGEVSYDIKCRESDDSDPYWYGSTLLYDNGSYYFIDDIDMTVGDITDEYCLFKARNIKYKVIPN